MAENRAKDDTPVAAELTEADTPKAAATQPAARRLSPNDRRQVMAAENAASLTATTDYDEVRKRQAVMADENAAAVVPVADDKEAEARAERMRQMAAENQGVAPE